MMVLQLRGVCYTAELQRCWGYIYLNNFVKLMPKDEIDLESTYLKCDQKKQFDEKIQG